MPKHNQDRGKGFSSIARLFQFEGTNQLVTVNTSRPMDQASLQDILSEIAGPLDYTNGQFSNIQFLAGMSVPHLIQNMFVFDRFLNNAAFKLSMQRLFRIIRTELKSNLPYTEEEFMKMIEAAVCAYIKCKAIQLPLKYYAFEHGGMPHINRQLQKTSQSVTDTGLVNLTVYKCLQYPLEDILLRYNKLVPKAQLLKIPTKIKNLIDYLLDYYFIDQSHYNAQIYANIVRSVPAFSLDLSGNLVQAGVWDVAYGEIEDVFGEIDAILTKYAVPFADLAKTGLFSSADLIYMDDVTLTKNAQFRNDPRMFEYIINNYSSKCKSIIRSDGITHPYYRLDLIKPEADDLLMATLGLGQIAGYELPFKMVSQAVIYDAVPNKTAAPVNVRGKFTPNNSFIVAAEVVITQDVAYQTDGFVDVHNVFRHNTSATSIIYVGALDNLFQPSQFAGVSAAAIYPIDVANLKVTKPRLLPGTVKSGTMLVCNNSSYATPYAIWKRWKVTGSTSASLDIVFGTYAQFDSDRIDGNPDVGTVLFSTSTSVPNGCTWTFTGNSEGYTWNVIVPITTTITLASGVRDNVINYIYARINNIYDGADCIWQITVTNVTTASTWDIERHNDALIKRYIDDVEFHMPVVDHVADDIFDNNTPFSVVAAGNLYKTDYVPAITDESAVKSALYWAFLGLFDMYGKNTSTKQTYKSKGYKKDKGSKEEK